MKVICIGDSSVNVFLQIPSGSDAVSIENGSRLMQFRLGSKIQLEKEIVTVGGNALNVAVGLSRQGISIDFHSIIGDDSDGKRIIEFLENEKTSLDSRLRGNDRESSENENLDIRKNSLEIRVNPIHGLKTNVGYAINYNSERFLLIDTSPKTYTIPPSLFDFSQSFGEAQWLFLSSIGTDYANTFRTVIEHKKSSNFKLAYNPSSNELKNSVGTYLEMIKNSDILFVNKKEGIKIIEELLHCSIASLLEKNNIRENPLEIPARNSLRESVAGGRENPSPEMQLLLQELYRLNSKIVVITDGVRGSFCYDGKKAYFEVAQGGVAKEKTGAGDAYESGFLAQYLKTDDIQSAMKNGTENASSVIKFIGAVEGLLYK